MLRQILKLWRKLKYVIQHFNLFPSIPPSTDQHQLRNQFISTRLFIFLFSSFFSILLLYNSLITIRKTVIVKSPSFTDYVQLNATYSQTLTCPCTQISIDYKNIVRVNYTLHQVCSSVFITQNWINSIHTENTNSSVSLFYFDFRSIGTYAFQALKSICELLDETIIGDINVFYLNQFISTSVIPYNALELQIQDLINRLHSSIVRGFWSSLSMIRETTQGNALYSTGTMAYIFRLDTRSRYLYMTLRVYDNCSCASSATCVRESIIYNAENGSISFRVPKFYIGCSTVEALLQSTLQCFYDRNCIDSIQAHLFPVVPVTPLDPSISSNYLANSTVDELLQRLMIEQWDVSLMYENYYEQCKPVECSHISETRNDAVFVVTTLIGLLGGLVTALKVVVPLLVNFIRRKKEEDRPAV
ncbi:unnamed protein product, partial [Adineta ricciae]